MNGWFLLVLMGPDFSWSSFRLQRHKKFCPMRIACVGESTAEVFKKYHLDVELIAKDSTAEGLAKERRQIV